MAGWCLCQPTSRMLSGATASHVFPLDAALAVRRFRIRDAGSREHGEEAPQRCSVHRMLDRCWCVLMWCLTRLSYRYHTYPYRSASASGLASRFWKDGRLSIIGKGCSRCRGTGKEKAFALNPPPESQNNANYPVPYALYAKET